MTNYNFIYEMTNIVPNSDIEILETTSIPNSKSCKITFEAQLQDANKPNKNGRVYSTNICQEIVNILKPKAKARALLQEVDHPVVDPSTAAGRRRAIMVSIQQCGTVIRDLNLSNDGVIGEIETLSGFLGPDVAHLLVDDKVDIGFSLRMFGKLVTENNITRVQKPIRPITYDIVTNPSHDSARVLQFLPENINSFVGGGAGDSDVQLLEELAVDNIDMIDSNQSIYDYLDQLIRESFNNLHGVNFAI